MHEVLYNKNKKKMIVNGYDEVFFNNFYEYLFTIAIFRLLYLIL